MPGGQNNGNGHARETDTAYLPPSGGDPPCEDCGATSFDVKSKALELSVSYCQTEALLEITKMNKGEKSLGVPSPNSILARAKQFEAYLNDKN